MCFLKMGVLRDSKLLHLDCTFFSNEIVKRVSDDLRN